MKKYPFFAAAVLVLSLAGSAHAQISAEITVGGPPPPPRGEVVPVAPGPADQYLWHKGYWHVRDHNYVWVPGAYKRRPHRGAGWVEPVYAQRGDHWGYTEGHWR